MGFVFQVFTSCRITRGPSSSDRQADRYRKSSLGVTSSLRWMAELAFVSRRRVSAD